MTDVSDVIKATFEKAESDEKCKASADALRALYEADRWEPVEILKVIAASRKADEAG